MFSSVRYFIFFLPVGITVVDEIGMPSIVTGVSMMPSFNPHLTTSSRKKKMFGWWEKDLVWVKTWKKSDIRKKLRPGDVIALRSPVHVKEVLIKRVVATPGQKIRSLKGRNYVLSFPNYWVEGDNFKRSYDSTNFGPVPAGLIVGQVTHILWPPHRWQKINSELSEDQRSRTLKCR